ncbi:TPA: GBS Bsp-like repeat-containing protein, partial [Streptococcus suis]
MKKRTLFFLSVCAVALNGYVVHADSLEAPSQLVTVPNLPGTGGQLTVVEEAGQMKAILSNITGEIVGVTGQFKSETNTGKTIAFTIDASGQYVAFLDRADFSNQEELYSLSLAANLLDGSSHVMSDYTFKLTKVEEVQRTEDNLSTETDPSESTVISESKPENSSETADITPIETGSSSSSSLAEKVTETTTAEVIETPVTSNNIDDVLTSIGTQLRSASALRYAGEAGGRGSAGQSVTRTITKVQQKEQILEISYTPPIKSNEIIQFAVWSEKLNQDDIIWYNADKTGAAYVDLRKYRDYGKYHIHTYSNMNGKMVFLDKVEINVKEPVVDQKIIQTSDTTFDVVLTNVPNYYIRVQIPVWSDQNGQDELKWYEAVRQADGS